MLIVEEKSTFKRGRSEKGAIVTMRVIGDGWNPLGTIEVDYVGNNGLLWRGWYPNNKKGMALAQRTYLNFLGDLNLLGEAQESRGLSQNGVKSQRI